MSWIKETMCDANNLYAGAVKTISSSPWKEATQRFEFDLLSIIFQTVNELETMTYHTGPVGRFLLNERGKTRPICTLGCKDRMVRHVLCDNVLMPAIRKKIIYDNCSSIQGRGLDLQRRRFEIHLHRFYNRTGSNKGYILLGDFSKFYDNIVHEIAINQFLDLLDHDLYLNYILTDIFKNFEIDVSYMSDEDYENCMDDVFNKLEYRTIPRFLLTGEKWMPKSVNMGDQVPQLIGIFYPNEIDQYVKTRRGFKEYGRYTDDYYAISDSYDELVDLQGNIERIATPLGIHINKRKTRIVKLSDHFRYLQVMYSLMNSGRVYHQINPKRVTGMRKRIKKTKENVLTGQTTYEHIEEMYRSWMGAYYKLMSRQQRQNLIALFENLYEVKITISNGKMKFLY